MTFVYYVTFKFKQNTKCFQVDIDQLTDKKNTLNLNIFYRLLLKVQNKYHFCTFLRFYNFRPVQYRQVRSFQ